MAGRHPLPRGKLRVLGRHDDVVIRAAKAHQEPLLGLPAPTRGWNSLQQFRRQLVAQPIARAGDEVGLAQQRAEAIFSTSI